MDQLAKRMSLKEIYASLSPEDGQDVAEAGVAIKSRIDDVARTFFEVGDLLTHVHAVMPSKVFSAWVVAEVGLSRSYSYKLIAIVAKCRDAGLTRETRGSVRVFLDTLALPEELSAPLLQSAKETGELRREAVDEAMAQEREAAIGSGEIEGPPGFDGGGSPSPVLMRSEEDLAKANIGALTSSKSQEHYTPAPIIDAARATLGHVDLDPASCSEANSRLGATVFYTKKQDGLGKPWLQNVFLNWPGGVDDDRKSIAKKWSDKLLSEIDDGRTENAIVILYKWMHSEPWLSQLLARSPAVCLLGIRTNFVLPGGDVQGGMPHSSGVILLSESEEMRADFLENFAALGFCVPAGVIRPWTFDP